MLGDHSSSIKMIYSINDAPPVHLCVLLGLQQFLTMIGGTIATPLLVAQATCVSTDLVGRAQILGTLMFVNGLCTLIQTLLGARLPIIQGASFAFIAPMLAMQNIPEFKCPDFGSPNSTVAIGSENHRAIWMSRLVEVQGAMLISGAISTFLGAIGVIGILLKAIGPLTIAPTIGLVGLSFADDIVSGYAAKYWPVAIFALVMVLLFSLYLCELSVPLPTIRVENGKLQCKILWFRLFGLFPVLISMLIVWAFCAVLTAFNVFPTTPGIYGYEARTDTRLVELSYAEWIRFPYPGQWGVPRVSVAIVLGMVAAMFATIIETIGDFYACARLCGARPPPAHAVNRGIFIEGIGCMLSGAFGCGPGVTSYAENIGAIAITRVASRRVFYVAAFMLIVFGCITKIAAVFVLIPDPILGGVLIAMLSMVSAVGFSNLQFIDFNSTRNLLIFGLSMFLGVSLPIWVKNNQQMIKTGSAVFDEVLIVLLSTGMLVGGLTGFFLDNTVPGATRQQRGFHAFAVENVVKSEEDKPDDYNIPLIGPHLIKLKWTRFVPISPTFDISHMRRKNRAVEPSTPPVDDKIEDISDL